MPKISRPRSLRVAELGLSVRASVKLAMKDREKEFGTSNALIGGEIPGQTDGLYLVSPMEPATLEPLPY